MKCLIFPQYKPNNPVSLQRIAPAEALQRLIDAGVWVSSEPDDIRQFVIRIQSLPCYDLAFETLGEAMSTVKKIRNGDDFLNYASQLQASFARSLITKVSK